MDTKNGFEKWDEPFVADPVTAFIKDQQDVNEFAENDKTSWGDDSKWPGYPLHGSTGQELLVLPSRSKSSKSDRKQQYHPTPKQLAAEHLNSVTTKANIKLRRTRKYGNHSTRKSTDNP